MSARKSQRAVALGCAVVLSIAGGMCLLLATMRLDTMPAEYVCQDLGYATTDCLSVNQSAFTNKFAPPCCVGPVNASNSWASDPLDELEQLINHVGCSEIAQSARAGITSTAPLQPGEMVPEDTLTEFEALAESGCTKARLENGFYYLYLSAPLVLLSCVVCTIVYLRGVDAAHALCVALIAVTAVECLTANNVLLHMRATHLNYQRRIMCSSLPQRFVKDGVYLGAFECADVMVSGAMKLSPTYGYLSQNMNIFFAGTAFAFVSMGVFGFMLGLNMSKAGMGGSSGSGRRRRGHEEERGRTLGAGVDGVAGAAGGYVQGGYGGQGGYGPGTSLLRGPGSGYS